MTVLDVLILWLGRHFARRGGVMDHLSQIRKEVIGLSTLSAV